MVEECPSTSTKLDGVLAVLYQQKCQPEGEDARKMLSFLYYLVPYIFYCATDKAKRSEMEEEVTKKETQTEEKK